MMPVSDETKEVIKQISDKILPYLNEKQRRLFLAASAEAIGRGGVTEMSRMTGTSRTTVTSGISEIHQAGPPDTETAGERIRRKGSGRKSAREKFPDLYEKIENLVAGEKGAGQSDVLIWTTMSLRKIAAELREKYNIIVSQNIVSRSLEALGYIKQRNQIDQQIGGEQPDRNLQFEYINNTARVFLESGEPVISVDTREKTIYDRPAADKTENQDAQGGQGEKESRAQNPQVIPHGCGYILDENTGYVNMGEWHEIPCLEVESINRWWDCVGRNTFPDAKKLYITAEGRNSGNRIKMWKYGLQELANRTGLEIHVSHYPSGTARWNRVAHRLFCYISKSLQDKTMISSETVISLISSGSETDKPRVTCRFDGIIYELKHRISDEDMNSLFLERCEPFGNWNYIMHPHVKMT